MKYILVLALCLLATTKVNLQTSFSKARVQNLTDALFFNGLIFLSAAVLFLPKIPGCSPAVWLYGGVFGVLTVVFQLTYTRALALGNVSLTVMIVNLSLVIPVILSAVLYNEPLSGLRILGIVLTLAAFVINLDWKDRRRGTVVWLVCTLLAFAANAGLTVTQKIFAQTPYHGENLAYVAISYVVAGVVTAVVYQPLKRFQPRTYKAGKRAWLTAAATGGVLAGFLALNLYTTARVEGTFLFPAYAGGSMLFSTLSGLLLFRDHLQKKQILGVALGIAAVILMNF